jgi:hypothetical protein
MRKVSIYAATLALLVAASARATIRIVPDDFTTIQAALNVSVAGDSVQVRDGTPYAEKITFPASGSAGAGYITLEAFPGDQPILDGTGVAGANMVLIQNRSYVKLIGFEIRDNVNVNDGSGVRVLGSGSHIEIRNNRIHDMRGDHAMGITVYGTAATPISDLIIDGNEIYDCEPFQSEALTLNGNVTNFQVTNNIVRDVNNIGIDFIGGESDIQPDVTKVARNGIVRGNTVLRANEQGGGYAGGIYVDGGKDILIERNVVSGSDLGIEIGAENSGIITSGVIVRDNVVYANEKVGIVFGGYKASVGRVKNCQFLNNTLYKNDTLGEGLGELWIQYAEDNQVRNNVFYGTAQNLLVYSENGNVNNTLDYNLFYVEAGSGSATFVWQSTEYTGFAAYKAGTGQDAHSTFGDPLFANASSADFHVGATSPAVNRGDPAFVPGSGEVDLDGAARLNGPRVDTGVDEVAACGDGDLDFAEVCDAGGANGSGGTCCAATCVFKPNGSASCDGNECTRPDTCTNGVCTAGACANGQACTFCGGMCNDAGSGCECSF